MKRGAFSMMRQAGVILALFAFALKAFVPAGYMVAESGQIELCGSMGARTITLHADGTVTPSDQPDPQEEAQSDWSCVFGALAAPALPAAEIALAAPRGAYTSSVPAPLAAQPAAPHTGPPLPARGPPSYA